MRFYEKELKALHYAKRFRSREVVDYALKDFASNDYLGFAKKREFHIRASELLLENRLYAPKASMLVNGYHQIHKDFEEALCRANGFEAGIVLGSGFNANIAIIEALMRRGDMLFMDELYHASGVLASQLGSMNVCFFRHNDMQHLEELLQASSAKRKLIAVEGIYSMDGDLCAKEVFGLADTYEAILLVDEAHSSGVVGSNLMGVFEHYHVEIKENYIKMGTLGKAYGSFGAFILSSKHINEYLINRAKPIIYATALSLYDTLVAHQSLEYILSHSQILKREIEARKEIVFATLHRKMDGLILPIVYGDNSRVMQIKESLLEEGFSIGAIRQPTVSKAIVRVIATLGESRESLQELLSLINGEFSR